MVEQKLHRYRYSVHPSRLCLCLWPNPSKQWGYLSKLYLSINDSSSLYLENLQLCSQRWRFGCNRIPMSHLFYNNCSQICGSSTLSAVVISQSLNHSSQIPPPSAWLLSHSKHIPTTRQSMKLSLNLSLLSLAKLIMNPLNTLECFSLLKIAVHSVSFCYNNIWFLSSLIISKSRTISILILRLFDIMKIYCIVQCLIVSLRDAIVQSEVFSDVTDSLFHVVVKSSLLSWPLPKATVQLSTCRAMLSTFHWAAGPDLN